MSTRSMTGHGRGVATRDGIRVEVEVGSVNRKQLDVGCSLPRPLAFLESRVIEVASAHLVRGRVTIDVAVARTEGGHGSVKIDETLAAGYLKGLRSLAKRLQLPLDGLSPLDLVNLPGVMCVESPEEDVERVWPVLRTALDAALRGHTAMRKREGVRLEADLVRRAAAMRKCLAVIRRTAPAVATKYRATLRARIKAAMAEISVPEERIDREIVLFADRSDITEELTRLDSHLDQVRVFLDSPGPAGRSLDFLAQELLREINTIGSKANDGAIARQVVTFKSELERFREQVQNIE